MNQVFRIAMWIVLYSIATSSATAQTTEDTKPAQVDKKPEQRALKKEIKAFQPFVGIWIFDGQWLGGDKLWAKNVYVVGMNGNFVDAKTFAKNEHGKTYQRYHTIWRFNPEKEKVESFGFSFDGSVTITDADIDMSDPKHPVIRSQWKQKPPGQIIKQEVRLIDENNYNWKIWSSADGKDWTPMMDGVWKKQK